MYRPLVFAVLYALLTNSWASDSLRELEYAEEIEASFSVGKVTWLDVKGGKFLALYTETEDITSQGTAILLHSMDGHPNQKMVINPLRTYLPKHNWATLSLQMPVLGVGAKESEYYALFADASARVESAITFLQAADVKNIVLIGYGLGGTMATFYINKNSHKAEVKAIANISLVVPKSQQENVQVLKFIENIKIPFLDIFAEFDSAEVTQSARQRRVVAKINPAYRQVIIKGEGHLFQHDEGLLVKRVYSWINRVFR